MAGWQLGEYETAFPKDGATGVAAYAIAPFGKVLVKTGVEVGKKVTVGQLRHKGFEAAFFAIGTQKCKTLDIEGEDLSGVHAGLDYLRKINLGKTVKLGQKVAVIGGGNVAVDAAHAARRLGTAEVFVLYRRGLEEMPAKAEELEELKEEGIPIHFLTQPVRFVGAKGKLKAIECVKMRLGKPDASGRPRPVPVRGSEFTIEVDAAITALNEEADWACLTPECACELTKWGGMQVDPVTFQSHDPDVFAGGDAVRGPSTVIEAIADGKQAAISIDRFLNGEDLHSGRGQGWVTVQEVQKTKFDPAKRAAMPRLPAKKRLEGFDEVQLGLSETAAAKEGQRCLGCGTACIQACPYGVIQFSPEAAKTHKCDLCATRVYAGDKPVCAEVCLTDAIAFGEVDLLRENAEADGLEVVDELSRESILYVL